VLVVDVLVMGILNVVTDHVMVTKPMKLVQMIVCLLVTVQKVKL
jgi:hypothetical protein